MVDVSIWNQPSKFLEKSKIGPFCFKIDKNDNFEGNSNYDCELYNWSILDLNVPKKALWMALWLSLAVLIKMISFKGMAEPWNSVLLIHNIDAICIYCELAIFCQFTLYVRTCQVVIATLCTYANIFERKSAETYYSAIIFQITQKMMTSKIRGHSKSQDSFQWQFRYTAIFSWNSMSIGKSCQNVRW